MKELYTEGVANHGDPESCTSGREAAGEALTGARTGEVLSREILDTRVPTPFNEAEGNMEDRVIASGQPTLRGRRPSACAQPSSARTGRSRTRPRDMAARAASGRPSAVIR
jgi:RNA-directed DNA polymerase